MIAALAVGIPVLVAIAFAWFRAASDRRNRRSMRRYGSALDRLGDVSRRSDAVAPVQLPSKDAIARPHFGLEPSASEWVEPEATILQPIVKLSPNPPVGRADIPVFDDVVDEADASARASTDMGTAAALARMVARSRSAHEASGSPVPPRHPDDAESVRLRRLAPASLHFSDLDADLADDERELSSGEHLGQSGPRRGRLPVVAPPAQVQRRRRVVVLTTAAVVLCGAGIAAATQFGGSPSSSSTSTTVASGSSGHHAVTSTSTPDVLRPVSATTALVVYNVPTRSYVVRFSATGACWLGSQRSDTGPYLWMDTLSTGQTTTYSATGTRIIRLGAPAVVTLSVNGIPVVLPTNNVLSYKLELHAPAR